MNSTNPKIKKPRKENIMFSVWPVRKLNTAGSATLFHSLWRMPFMYVSYSIVRFYEINYLTGCKESSGAADFISILILNDNPAGSL